MKAPDWTGLEDGMIDDSEKPTQHGTLGGKNDDQYLERETFAKVGPPRRDGNGDTDKDGD